MKCEEIQKIYDNLPSLPARGAWIEINFSMPSSFKYVVAPRTGGVD